MYFVKTEQVGGKARLKPLANQTLSTGEPVKISLYVSAEDSARTENPIGTIFAVEDLELSSGGFYIAKPKTLIPVTGSKASVTSREVDEYEKFLDKVSGLSDDTAKPHTAKPKAKRVTKTQLELLLERHPVPTVSESGYYINPKTWASLLLQISDKENTLLTGPTGTAKTEIVTFLAKSFGKTLHIFDMSAQQDPVSGLLGVHRLNEKGQSYFDYAKFAQVIQEPDTWVLLDEVNRAPMSATNILFPLTDFRRRLEVSVASSKGVRDIDVHEDVIFFATANLGSEYSGTNQVDRALRDRFSEVELNYPPTAAEIEILVDRTGVDSSFAEKICKVAEKLRAAKEGAELSMSPSVRHTLKVAARVKKGMPLKDAFDTVVMPLYDIDERTTVNTMLGGMV